MQGVFQESRCRNYGMYNMKVVENIEDYVGIPYKDRGRNQNEGYDCWGLILELTNKIFNVSLPDPEYKIETVEEAENLFLANNIWKWVEKVELNKIKYGDLVSIKQYGKGRMPYHMGLYIGNKEIIHILKCGVVIQKINIIKNYITGIYRIKNDSCHC